MTVPLSPVLAAATRLMHGDYDATLASRRQREIDVQEVAGGLILLAARHTETVEALTATTELLANLLNTTSTRPSLHWRIQIDERIQANQTTLELDVPEGGR